MLDKNPWEAVYGVSNRFTEKKGDKANSTVPGIFIRAGNQLFPKWARLWSADFLQLGRRPALGDRGCPAPGLPDLGARVSAPIRSFLSGILLAGNLSSFS